MFYVKIFCGKQICMRLYTDTQKNYFLYDRAVWYDWNTTSQNKLAQTIVCLMLSIVFRSDRQTDRQTGSLRQ